MIGKLVKQLSGASLVDNKEHAQQLIKATKGQAYYVPFTASMVKGRRVKSNMYKRLASRVSRGGRPSAPSGPPSAPRRP
tara:strand:+ start:1030 stop:1266 length:237 start_codon:yes stop_codon:yes gene_type:complete